MYVLNLTPIFQRSASAGFKVLVKTQGADVRPKWEALEVVEFLLEFELEVLMVHWDCEGCNL